MDTSEYPGILRIRKGVAHERASRTIGPEKVVREIRRKTRRKFSSEEKIRIVYSCFPGRFTLTTLPDSPLNLPGIAGENQLCQASA